MDCVPGRLFTLPSFYILGFIEGTFFREAHTCMCFSVVLWTTYRDIAKRLHFLSDLEQLER